MGYPDMSAEVFQNANISLLACQLFVMVIALTVSLISLATVCKSASKKVPRSVSAAGLSSTGAKV